MIILENFKFKPNVSKISLLEKPYDEISYPFPVMNTKINQLYLLMMHYILEEL